MLHVIETYYPIRVIIYRTSKINVILKKSSSVFMMLLVATASLVAISSIIYQPTNVETQPQQQQQQPQQIPGSQGLIIRGQEETMFQAMVYVQLAK
ncbi:MAG TPA: hypothetical protein VIP70_13500 [Nitrososphaeraceae archaeon]